MGRQHQGMDKPEVRQVPEGSGEQRRMEKTGCEVTCGGPTTVAVVKRQVKVKAKVKDLIQLFGTGAESQRCTKEGKHVSAAK